MVEDDRDEGDRDLQENARLQQQQQQQQQQQDGEGDEEDLADDPENERAEDQRDLEPNDLGLFVCILHNFCLVHQIQLNLIE